MSEQELSPEPEEEESAEAGSEPVAAVESAPAISADELKEAITARGRERGFVTSEEILEGVPVEDLAPEALDLLLTQIEEHLRVEGIEIIEAEPGDLEPEPEVTGIRLPRDDEFLKAPTNDPVRMYLKEIGKVPLLTAPQEVDLAMRIEAGEFSTALLDSVDGEASSNGGGARTDQKQFKTV
ncbi:MAG TPA: sigma-70 factor domain-containing protein, partial [Actinomycetota bacterium]|nr:sigma-70 factor domain-containing protein [Actinomycetota bacterium]